MTCDLLSCFTGLVSIARSKPTAFEAVSFQQVLPLPFDGGADPLIRAGTPGPAFPQIDNSEEADEGVGCGPGGPPHKTKWHCAKCVRQTLEATFSRNQSYRLAAGSCLEHRSLAVTTRKKAIVSILVLAGLTGCAGKPLPVLGEIPPFELLNQQGRKFDRTALDGHVWVADFIFTNCEGPCPRMTSRMHAIQKATGAGIKLVSFSVDPQRDTPQALAEYGRKFAADDARWTFLTGNPAILDMLDRDAFKLGNLGAAMDHSTRFVLIDKKGRIRGYYSLGDDNTVSRVTKDAARLEAEIG